jgi:hypothetical protein
MQTFWNALTITLLVTCFVSGVLVISMYWRPKIPSAPRPAEGRIYPLKIAHSTYMNRSEYLLHEWILSCFPLVVLALGAIQYLADPFGELRRRRLYGRPQNF